MGKTEKELLDEIVAAAAQRGLSLNNILSLVKKHKFSYRGPSKLKIDILNSKNIKLKECEMNKELTVHDYEILK